MSYTVLVRDGVPEIKFARVTSPGKQGNRALHEALKGFEVFRQEGELGIWQSGVFNHDEARLLLKQIRERYGLDRGTRSKRSGKSKKSGKSGKSGQSRRK